MTSHSDCYNWCIATRRLIKGGKWDQIVKKPLCEECFICGCDDPVRLLLSDEKHHFSAKSEEVIYRIFGEEFNQKQWFDLFWCHQPSISALRYLIQKGRITPDYCDKTTLLGRMFVYYSQPYIDFLLDEAGANVNVQSETGNTPLLNYLRKMWNIDDPIQNRIDITAESWKRDLTRLEGLLKKGADPLLENKKGVSALSYAERFTVFSESQKEELLALLRYYA